MSLSPSNGEPEVVVLADADAVSAAAAARIAEALADAVRARGRADWATTGGSAAPGIYRYLSVPPLREQVPWRAVHIWLGDERFVPRDHPQSNVMPVDQILASMSARAGQSTHGEDAHDVFTGVDAGAAIPAANIHAVPVARAIADAGGPSGAAAAYEDELRDAGLPTERGWPIFDLVVVGVGPDGHLLSVFPGSPALANGSAWALGIDAPTHVEPNIARITLNPRILDVARRVLVVAHGGGKADILGSIFGPERDPRRWPAQLARRAGVTWLIDEAAAQGFRRR